MGAECSRCGSDIYDECRYCAIVDERDRMRAAVVATRDYIAAAYGLANLPEHMDQGRINYGRIRSKLRCADEQLRDGLAAVSRTTGGPDA